MNPADSTANDESSDMAASEAPCVSRLQHLIPAAAVLLLAISVAWLSFTREPAGAFLFPRIIGSIMLLLALWNFIRAFLGMSRVGQGLSAGIVVNIIPGVVVMLLLVYVAAKTLGFYTAAWLAFLSVYSLYDPASHRDAGTWLKRLLITTGFMAVIYALFTLLLKVQTPRGLWF